MRLRKAKKLVDNYVPLLNWSVLPISCTLIIIIISKNVSSSGCYRNLASIRPSLNLIPHGRTVPNQRYERLRPMPVVWFKRRIHRSNFGVSDMNIQLLDTGWFDLQVRSPYEVVMHYTQDILEYVSYTWFQRCWYFNEPTKSK